MFASNIFDAFQLLSARTNPVQVRPIVHRNPPPLIPPPPAADETFEEAPSPSPMQGVIVPKQFTSSMMEAHFTPHMPREIFQQPNQINLANYAKPIEVENENFFEQISFPIQDLPKFDEPKKEDENTLKLSKLSKKIKKSKPPKLNRKIVKNFGKAIASFACSDKALKIIEKTIRYQSSSREKFINFVYDHKECIEGNRRFKQLLTVDEDDTRDIKENKILFKKMANIFMKSYVHQWIWNSKLMNKDLHAQLVGEMKKRITNPNLLESLSNE